MEKTKLSFQENQILTEREAGGIHGGDKNKPKSCGCGCYTQGQGGPSTHSVAQANYNKGTTDPPPKPVSLEDIWIRSWGLD